MKKDISLASTLHAAVLKLLRPLVRLLLRSGIPFGTFADLARWVYVDVALKEFGIPGRKQSNSRISIITGLNRKEVLRLRQMQETHNMDAAQQYNRAARVVGGWVRSARFHDRNGDPAELPFDTPGKASFSDLVKEFSGDVPARAVLDELLRVGTVEVKENHRVALIQRAYIPYGEDLQKLHILGTDVADLITTIDHNVSKEKDQALFQRKVAYDNVPAESVAAFRKLSGKEGQLFLEKMDRWLSKADRDLHPSAGGTGRKRVGIGVYYFEEDLKDEEPKS